MLSASLNKTFHSLFLSNCGVSGKEFCNRCCNACKRCLNARLAFGSSILNCLVLLNSEPMFHLSNMFCYHKDEGRITNTL